MNTAAQGSGGPKLLAIGGICSLMVGDFLAHRYRSPRKPRMYIGKRNTGREKTTYSRKTSNWAEKKQRSRRTAYCIELNLLHLGILSDFSPYAAVCLICFFFT